MLYQAQAQRGTYLQKRVQQVLQVLQDLQAQLVRQDLQVLHQPLLDRQALLAQQELLVPQDQRVQLVQTQFMKMTKQ
jgi:hypothetical protein